MNNFFENHLEEINSISNRSKKEQKKTFTRLQKANTQFVSSVNSRITSSYTKCIEGINVHQFTNDGKAIVGSSDRVYLPDVATRLYQNVDNVSMSYRSHKYHKSQSQPGSFEKGVSDIKYYEYSQNNTSDVTKYILNLYENFSDKLKSSLNIYFSVEKLYSIWSLYNDDGEHSEFDETFTYFTYKFVTKKSNEVIADGVIELPVNFNFLFPTNLEELKYVEKITEKILELDLIDKDKINPEFLYIDSLGAHQLFNQTYYIHEPKVTERFDKFGNQVKENDYELTKQRYYYDSPREFLDSLVLKKEIEESNEKLDLDKPNGVKYIYSFHTKENVIDNDRTVYPGALLYFDGNKLYRVQADMIDLNNVGDEDIKVTKDKEKITTKVRNKKHISLSGIKNAIVKFTSSIKIL